MSEQRDKTTWWVWVVIPGVSTAFMLMAILIDRPLAGGGVLVVGLCLVATWWNPQRARPKRKPIAAQEPRLPVASDTESLIRQMLDNNRSAVLVRDQIVKMLDGKQQDRARQALLKEMAVVPKGHVCMVSRSNIERRENQQRDYQILKVDPFYLDVRLVTNEQFARFVAAGGYELASLWDESVAPGTFEFVDQTGMPAPRFWRDAKYLVGQEDHPVVGISWFEASAYARWVGKRLPTDPEWVKAGSWPLETSPLPKQRKYPWGDEMDATRANVWDSAIGHTVEVTEFTDGVAVGGHHQMVGNVWEWTSDEFGRWDAPGAKIRSAVDLKSIRGAAYDTYFDFEATCDFQSGDYPLARRHNIGFRCALGRSDIGIDLGTDVSLEAVEAKP
jgi:iron(II)-dependent oxidoreductase